MPSPKKKTEEAKPIPEKVSGSTVHARHIAAAVDAVGHSLGKTFSGFGFCLVVFDKRKPEQVQHFLGGDGKACAAAMSAVVKKLEA